MAHVVWGFMFVFLTAFVVCFTQADRPPRTVYAGGRDGWRLLPFDGLNRWAAGKRFRVNDTIIFDYQKGNDSVLVVRKRQYYHCNKTSPIHHLTDGHSRLKFTRNGDFYFISGFAENCLKGQKLHVVVMSPNHIHPPPPPPPPVSNIPSPSPSPAPQLPPPSSHFTPAPSPSPTITFTPTPSPSPVAQTPPPSSPPVTQTPPPASTPVPSHSPWSPSPSPITHIPPPALSPDVDAPSPSVSSGDGWITAPAPKNSGSSTAVISWGFTVVAGLLICMV